MPDSSVKGNTEEFINLININMLKCFSKLSSLIFCLRRERESAKETQHSPKERKRLKRGRTITHSGKNSPQLDTNTHIHTAVVSSPHSQLFVTVT